MQKHIGELSAQPDKFHLDTYKAAENDCLERRNSIRPRFPSHVAYEFSTSLLGSSPFGGLVAPDFFGKRGTREAC